MSQQGGGGEPRYSPDGRFWWDGQGWQPMPANRRRPPLLIGLGVLAFLLIGGLGATFAYTRTVNPEHAITGTMTLFDTSGYANGADGCAGQDGYGDIHTGAQVTVSDEAGKILATSSLGRGDDSRPYCVFTFRVDGVANAKTYQVEVSHRGKVAYSSSDLASKGWKVGLSIGS